MEYIGKPLGLPGLPDKPDSVVRAGFSFACCQCDADLVAVVDFNATASTVRVYGTTCPQCRAPQEAFKAELLTLVSELFRDKKPIGVHVSSN